MEASTINKIFDTLDKWKSFPAYQLERRVDIFFAIYLEKTIKHKFQIDVNHILPEFPVHKDTINHDGSNQSKKIDYVAISDSKILLIELKTDLNSKIQYQYEYYEKAQKNNIPNLIDGLLQIYRATKAKAKYEALFSEIIKIGWLTKEGKEFRNISKEYDIEVVFLQPILMNNENPKNIITFKDVIEAMRDEKDPITQRFIQSLSKWEIEAKAKERKNRKHLRS